MGAAHNQPQLVVPQLIQAWAAEENRNKVTISMTLMDSLALREDVVTVFIICSSSVLVVGNASLHPCGP